MIFSASWVFWRVVCPSTKFELIQWNWGQYFDSLQAGISWRKGYIRIQLPELENEQQSFCPLHFPLNIHFPLKNFIGSCIAWVLEKLTSQFWMLNHGSSFSFLSDDFAWTSIGTLMEGAPSSDIEVKFVQSSQYVDLSTNKFFLTSEEYGLHTVLL